MSYDLVFWKGSPSGEPAAVFRALSEGQPVEGVVALGIEEIARAFELDFGARVRFDDGRLSGPGFDIVLSDDGRHFVACCAWGVVKDSASRKILTAIRSVASRRLGCHTFNPQLDIAMPPATARPGRADAPPKDDLEARVRMSDSEEDWALYAAELRAKGDPRGSLIDLDEELMTIYRVSGFPLPQDAHTNALRARIAEAEKLVTAQRTAAQRGFLSDWIAQKHVTLGLKRGFVDWASVEPKTEPVLRSWPRIVGRLLRHETARLLRSLDVIAHGSFDEVCEDGMQVIAAAPYAESLRSLKIETHVGAIGDLGPMLAATSLLEQLALRVESVLLRPIQHDSLTNLEISAAVLDADDLGALAASELPKLTRLVLAPSPYVPGTKLPVDGLASLMSGKATPQLTQLTLGGYVNVSEIVSELMRGARFRELTELGLQDADEPLARLLLDASASLGALETLELGAATHCSIETARELERVFGSRLSMCHAGLIAERPVVQPRARPMRPAVAPKAPALPLRPPARPASRAEAAEVEEGARVRHAKFGSGVVTELGDDRAAVRFEDGTVRRLALTLLTPEA